MSGIGNFNGKNISSTDVSNIGTIKFNNNFIYQGTAANTSGVVEADNVEVDLNLYLETADSPDKHATAEAPKSEDFLDIIAGVGAKVAVQFTSLLSGVLDVGEAVVDGGAWVVSGALSLVGLDEAATDVKDFIATDWVDEANKAFYENTELGKAINETSELKYDSEAAQGIRDVSEKVTVFAAATALTVCTGGAASAVLPAAVGFAYGAGSKAEDVYQKHGTDTVLSQELGIAVSGIGEAANWFALGKMGGNGLDVLKKVGELGFKNAGTLLVNGFKSSIEKIGQRSLTQNLQMFGSGIKNLVKGTFNKSNLSRAFSNSLRDIDNLTDSIGIIGDNLAAWLTGDEKLNLQSVLSTTAELGGAFLANMTFSALGEYLTKAKRIDDIPKMNDTQRQNVDGVFDLEHQVAQDKYLESFKTYREHAELHTQAVTDYAVMLGLDLDSIDETALAEIYYGAYFHDLGMAGGGVDANGMKYGLNYNKATGEYIGLLDDIADSKKAGNTSRANHPLNSALSVLSGDVVPAGLDKDKIALLALSHSKSTSGVSSFMDPKQWDAAITKLDDAVNHYNQINGLTDTDAIVFDADRMRQIISDPSSPEFKQLVDQALCIRDGDAMSDLALTADGHTIMQTGTIAHVESPQLNLNEPIPSLQDELAAVVDKVTDENGNQLFEVDDEFGKLFHAGEENVNFDSTYNGNTYVGRVELVDSQRVPNSTIFVINERLGELATYTNCDRSFIIELPQKLIETPYGDSFVDSIEDTLRKNIADATKKFDEGRISKDQLDSIIDFYKNGITIPGFGKLEL